MAACHAKRPSFLLAASEVARLQQWVRAGSTPQQVVLRSRIALLASEGQKDQHIAQSLEVLRRTVALWRHRILDYVIGSVWEIQPGRGRKSRFDRKVVNPHRKGHPAHQISMGHPHWSTRSLARAQKVSKNTIQRIWQDHQSIMSVHLDG